MQRKGNDNYTSRKKKGHRQKGSGTVTVSKGETTRQGVLCKEWQRTPMQLLNEYVQSKKKLRATYHSVKPSHPSKFRSRVVLPDGKNSAKDLKFCPEQSFPSVEDAKHHAALLALHYLEPLRPFERKLPDPYREVWFVLVGEQSKKKTAPPPPPPTTTNELSSLWGSSSNDTEVNPPPVVPTAITADRKFASHAEYQASQLEKKQDRNRKNRKHENRKRANPNIQVFMGASARAIVESVITKDTNNSKNDNERKQVVVDEIVAMGFTPEQAELAVKNASCKESALDYLFLNLPENQLPSSFNPIGTQLDVVSSSSSSTLDLKKLMSLGFCKSDCLESLAQGNGDFFTAFSMLHSKLVDYLEIPINTTSSRTSDEELLVQEEFMALEAIYADGFVKDNSTIHISTSSTSTNISIELPQSYPFGIPLVSGFKTKGSLSMLMGLIKLCHSLQGSPMIYEICSFIESFNQEEENDDTSMSIIVLFDKKTEASSVAEPSSSVVKPSVVKVSSKKKNKVVQRPSNTLSELKTLYENDTTYQSMLRTRQKLPAFKKKKEVLSTLTSHNAVLISGSTGCGKTTQIPQFILENAINNSNEDVSIICTQPRRIAAIGVATRVAAERGERLGKTIGYQIRMDNKSSRDTRLLFCTTGVLLRRLQQSSSSSSSSSLGVTHIIVDEVHERNVETDFLLTILKQKLAEKGSKLKVILMSATMNTDLFASYFNCPIISIPGFTFPVSVSYLEDFSSTLGIEEEEKKSSTTVVPAYHIMIRLIEYLVRESDDTHDNGSILVFLPGVFEIQKLVRMINTNLSGVNVIPLHGSQSPADQQRVFENNSTSKRKIIVSTNIAETSLTINDVTVVIDSGLVKESRYDSVNNMSLLVDTYTSVASTDQRKGRAGRVQAGKCFRVYTRKVEKKYMKAQQTPEMHRVSLEHLCLQIKVLKLDDNTSSGIAGFLNKAIEPPTLTSIESAITLLCEIGALTKKEELTPLGHHIGALPMDARVAKVVLFGCILQCIDPVLTVAATMSSGRSPFVREPEGSTAKQAFLTTGAQTSDHLSWVRAFDKWRIVKNQREFCKTNYISHEAMLNISKLRQSFARDLVSIGFLKSSCNFSDCNKLSVEPKVVKAALCAGFYANVIKVVYPETRYYESAQGALAANNKAKELKYFKKESKTNERVFLHPSSVNFTTGNYRTPFLVYSSMVKTSKVYVRESSMVSPYALLLFGGDNLEVMHDKGVLVMDEWIYFNAVPRIAVLVRALRRSLDSLLADKIATPTLDIAHTPLVKAMTHLLITEGL